MCEKEQLDSYLGVIIITGNLPVGNIDLVSDQSCCRLTVFVIAESVSSVKVKYEIVALASFEQCSVRYIDGLELRVAADQVLAGLGILHLAGYCDIAIQEIMCMFVRRIPLILYISLGNKKRRSDSLALDCITCAVVNNVILASLCSNLASQEVKCCPAWNACYADFADFYFMVSQYLAYLEVNLRKDMLELAGLRFRNCHPSIRSLPWHTARLSVRLLWLRCRI